MKRALISLSDKTGAVELAKGLVELGFEIISTGGTAALFDKNKIPNTQVSDITKFPECLDGRVKTLHPNIFGGILAMRSNASHMGQVKDLGLSTIDLVAVNLYPFKETISKPNVIFGDAVENIDIGGPSMIRAAAKNYQDVIVLVDSADYSPILAELKKGRVSLDTKKRLMFKAFSHTASYDALISNYLAKQIGEEFPEQLTLTFDNKQNMRYGENPHQKAAFYSSGLVQKTSVATAEFLQGKELSFNNINDAGGALDLLNEFSECACVAVKHTNPCGVAIAKTPLEAYKTAYKADPISIFGGIVVFNRKVCEKTAVELNKIFLEIIIAPDYDKKALEVFKAKPNLRVLKITGLDKQMDFSSTMDTKCLYGGLLVQGRDSTLFDTKDLKVVTKLKPTKDELKQLEFAYKVVKHTKSNAIVVAKNYSAIGIGGGQTNRIWAATEALERAGENVKGAMLASDAFFPFSDTVELAAKHGIRAIIQPGGSIKDADSIAACDKHGIAMVFVGQRHFKH